MNSEQSSEPIGQQSLLGIYNFLRRIKTRKPPDTIRLISGLCEVKDSFSV